jgi:uncharacterized protein
MFEKALIKIYKDFWNKTPEYIYRDQFESFCNAEQSLAIIGPRRAGKSYLLYQIKDDLIKKKKITKKHFLYVNFENLSLKGFDHNNYEEILNSYHTLYPEIEPIIFLDEIQNIDYWYKYARNLVDKGYLVFITGSNSKMISREIASQLGARFISLNVFPFTFNEFLKLKGEKYSKPDIIINENKIRKLFNEFLKYGSFPEILDKDDILKRNLLRTYFDLGIGDITKRWDVKDENALEFLVKKIKENITNESSIKSYYNFFKSINYKIDEREIYNFFKYLKDSFIITEIESQKKSITSRNYLKKFYFIDNGYILLFEVEKDEGSKLENLAMNSLLKMNYKINYYKLNKECDFIIKKNGKTNAIQVTYELNENNQDREINGLLNAMNNFNLKSGLILTYNQEDVIIKKKKKIIVKPIWKWLLEI